MKTNTMGRMLSLLLAFLMLAGSMTLAAFATGDGLGANYSAEDDMTPDNLGVLKSSSGVSISYLQQLKYASDWTDPVTGNTFSAGSVLPVGSATNAIHGGHHTRVLRTENGTYAVIITRTVERPNELVENGVPIDQVARYGDDHPYWINGYNYYSVVKLTPDGVRVILEDVCPENNSSHVPEIYAGNGDSIYVIFPGEDPDAYYNGWLRYYSTGDPTGFNNAGYLVLHEIDTSTDTVLRTKKAIIPFDSNMLDDHGYGKPSALVDLEAGKIYCIYDGGYGGNSYPGYFAWFIYDIKTNEWEPKCHTLNIEHRKDYYNLYPDGKGGATFIIQRCISNPQSPDILGIQLKPVNGFAWDSVYYYHIKDMEAVTFTNTGDLAADRQHDRDAYDYVEYPIFTPVYDASNANSASAGHYGNNGCTYQDYDGNIHVIYTVAIKNKPRSTTTYHSIIDPETDTEIYKEMIPSTLLKSLDGKANGASSYSAGMGFTMTQGPDGTFYLFHFTTTNPTTVEVFTSPADDGINFTRAVEATQLKTADGSTVSGGYPIIGNSRDGSIRDGVIGMLFNSTTNPANGSQNTYYYFSVDVGSVAQHEHDFVDTVVDPTCSSVGFTRHVCSICHKKNVDTFVDPVDHNWVVSDSAEATCTDAGYVVRTCSFCGKTETVSTDPLGHSFGEWSGFIAPSCTVEGTEVRECSKCHEQEFRQIDALGHNYELTETVEPTCYDRGYSVYACTHCGDSYQDDFTDALGHAWDDGVVTTEPTATEDGVRTFTCTRCGETMVEAIPATGAPTHIPGDINGDGVVNSKDLTRLLKYVSGNVVEVNEAALDVNGDGVVNSKDLTRLLKYVSGNDVEIF